MQPLVSIIIPVFNLEKYIYTGLESCIKQSYNNIEVLVVNDGSTDRSGDIIREFSIKDKRVESLEKQNGGVSSARNYALDRIKGEFVLFLDGDDWLEENTVEYLMGIKKHYSDYLISSGMYNVVYEGNRIRKAYSLSHPDDRIICLSQDDAFLTFGEKYRTLSACYKLFDSKIINENSIRFDEKIIYGEDGLFVFDYLHYCKGLVYQNVPLWNILTRPGSATATSFNKNYLTAIEATELMIGRKNNTFFATKGAVTFSLSRVEGLMTIALRDGIKNNITELNILRNKLKTYSYFNDKQYRRSLTDSIKIIFYKWCPFYLLRNMLAFARKIKKSLKKFNNVVKYNIV